MSPSVAADYGTGSVPCKLPHLYFSFFLAAHRAFCAAAMLARPAALRVRFPAVLEAGLLLLFLDLFGRPGLFFPGAGVELSASRARAWVSRAISASIEAIRSEVFMSGTVYVATWPASWYTIEAAELRHGLGPS